MRWQTSSALRVGNRSQSNSARNRCWSGLPRNGPTENMEFRIADTFTDSLTRLTNDEQKAVKTTAFDLQVNPTAAGLSVHRLDRARDKRFWSVRVSDDVRLIIHRDEKSLLLCYVDHHVVLTMGYV